MVYKDHVFCLHQGTRALSACTISAQQSLFTVSRALAERHYYVFAATGRRQRAFVALFAAPATILDRILPSLNEFSFARGGAHVLRSVGPATLTLAANQFRWKAQYKHIMLSRNSAHKKSHSPHEKCSRGTKYMSLSG